MMMKRITLCVCKLYLFLLLFLFVSNCVSICLCVWMCFHFFVMFVFLFVAIFSTRIAFPFFFLSFLHRSQNFHTSNVFFFHGKLQGATD